MENDKPIHEREDVGRPSEPDPDALPPKDRRVFTQPYDLVVESLVDQIQNDVIFLQPISERPGFQRRYVWNDTLASRLIESMLLNVPIPPCYLSQNDNFELDVIDGQQRLYSIYRFLDNRFSLRNLEVLKDLNRLRFHELTSKIQRQIKTHTLRLVAVTNDSHPDIKFDVFQRLNTNTVPLNPQELRNCVYRGALNDLLKDVVAYKPWLEILGKHTPDKRMRDEELALRFFAFQLGGVESYRTPQKYWLNAAAASGRSFSRVEIDSLRQTWEHAIDVALIWFEPKECFRRLADKPRAINRALFDLTMMSAATTELPNAQERRASLRAVYRDLLDDLEFEDLVSRAVDHTKRTKRRFAMWQERIGQALR